MIPTIPTAVRDVLVAKIVDKRSLPLRKKVGTGWLKNRDSLCKSTLNLIEEVKSELGNFEYKNTKIINKEQDTNQ